MDGISSVGVGGTRGPSGRGDRCLVVLISLHPTAGFGCRVDESANVTKQSAYNMANRTQPPNFRNTLIWTDEAKMLLHNHKRYLERS